MLKKFSCYLRQTSKIGFRFVINISDIPFLQQFYHFDFDVSLLLWAGATKEATRVQYSLSLNATTSVDLEEIVINFYHLTH